VQLLGTVRLRLHIKLNKLSLFWCIRHAADRPYSVDVVVRVLGREISPEKRLDRMLVGRHARPWWQPRVRDFEAFLSFQPVCFVLFSDITAVDSKTEQVLSVRLIHIDPERYDVHARRRLSAQRSLSALPPSE
jgi:hypothetical protein